MSSERKKVLEMLANGKINADEAERLLKALEDKKSENFQSKTTASGPLPKYLFVKVDSSDGDNVNIRVPLKLIRAGINLKSLLPREAQDKIKENLTEKGINLDDINPENFEEIIDALREFEVNVDEKRGDKVRIYCGNS
jgi:hypothetical protein